MSKPSIYDAGRFNRQLSIENEVETSDGCGGFTTVYQAQDTVWAHIRPTGASNLKRAGTDEVVVTHEIIIRHRAGVSAASRFITGSRKFDVLSVHDLDETRRYLKCNVEEVSA